MFGEAWCILSAKYGFVFPNDEIENYNVTFRSRSSEVIDVPRLREQVAAKRLSRFTSVQILGGSKYVERTVAAFASSRLSIEAPLAGLRIGEAMRAVEAATTSGTLLRNSGPANLRRCG